jgi:hypothetical protein
MEGRVDRLAGKTTNVPYDGSRKGVGEARRRSLLSKLFLKIVRVVFN